MDIVILKNTLLILLVIFILHFIIKNKLIDDINNERLRFKNCAKNVKNVESIESVKPIESVRSVKPASPSCVKQVRFADKKIEHKVEECEVVNDDFYENISKNIELEDKEYVDKCEGQLNCKNMIKATSRSEPLQKDKMKELYDFVFDGSEEKEAGEGEGLNKYFPTDVKDTTFLDSTELDKHKAEKLQEMMKQENNCNFEVIGVIEAEQLDDIHGLDSTSSSYFSQI